MSLGELPLTQLLGTGETVRAEDVVLRVPQGRSLRTLINATPINPPRVLTDVKVLRSRSDSLRGLAGLDAGSADAHNRLLSNDAEPDFAPTPADAAFSESRHLRIGSSPAR